MNCSAASNDSVTDGAIRALFGIHYVMMDAKGRVALPTKMQRTLRALPDSSLVLTANPTEEGLYLYPSENWDRVMETLVNARESFKRLLFGYARELEMDGGGRILLPAEHREYAQIRPEQHRQTVFVGVGRRWEIRSHDRWVECVNRSRKDVKKGLATDETLRDCIQEVM